MTAPFSPFTDKTELPPVMEPRFRWFSAKVSACLEIGGVAALEKLHALITDAEFDKIEGFGPPQDDINKARRKWLDLYAQIYRRQA